MESATNLLIKPEQFMNTILARNGEMGRAACEVMAAAINAVDPYQIINQYVKRAEKSLIIGKDVINLREVDRIFLIGFGKASPPMAKALLDILDEEVDCAEIITKSDKFLDESGYKQKLNIHLGGHPIPTKDSIESTRSVLENIGELTSNDLILAVISGGGSALFTDPIPGISLNDLKKMTELLLKSGAAIHEVNTLRKHLDRVKGGRLARRLHPAKVHTFILSDVIGDRLDMIASGTTVPDPTTFQDSVDIVQKYDLRESMPKSIINVLEGGKADPIEETLKPSDFKRLHVKNHLVGTNIKAAQAAKSSAEALAYNSIILTSHMTGHTCNVAPMLESIIQTVIEHDQPVKKPACLIFGGETTVRVVGEGKGGRNQDLVLQMVKRIADKRGVLVISLATDGEDGPTDAAGAVCDASVYHDGAEMLAKGIDNYLENNNAYNYFQELGGLIKIGSTGTNVNDLVLIFID